VDLDGIVRVARHAGLGERAALVEALAALTGDPGEIAAALRAHHLIRLVRSWVPEGELRARLPAQLCDALASQRAIGRASPERLLRAFDEVRRALEAAAVPVLLLKGLYFAERLYGGLDRRPQYDLDVLVHRAHLRRALRVLHELGFAPRKYDLHSRTVVRDDVSLDVHRGLRRAPAMRIDEDLAWATAIDARIGELAFRTLSDEYTLVFLAAGSLEDLGQGSARLKSLLDLYLLLRQVDCGTDWEGFFARRERERLLEITVNVFSLVAMLFEAAAELPGLDAALARRRELCVLGSRREALDLVAAARKAPASLAWFGRVYPGSLLHYLVWFWYGGFPANAREIGRLRSTLRIAFRGSRPPGSS
jgi:hypothetical protein